MLNLSTQHAQTMPARTRSRALAAIFAAAMAAVMAFALAGCGAQSDEAKAKAAVESAISNITSTDTENLKALFGEESYARLEAAGVNPADISKALFGRCKTEIGEPVMGEGTASMRVSITNADLLQGVSTFSDTALAWVTSDDAVAMLAEGGQEALTKKSYEMLLEALNGDLPEKTAEVVADVSKDSSGNWTFANEEGLRSAMLMGIDPGTLG